MTIAIDEAVDRVAAAIGELPEDQFDAAWQALGEIVWAITRPRALKRPPQPAQPVSPLTQHHEDVATPESTHSAISEGVD